MISKMIISKMTFLFGVLLAILPLTLALQAKAEGSFAGGPGPSSGGLCGDCDTPCTPTCPSNAYCEHNKCVCNANATDCCDGITQHCPSHISCANNKCVCNDENAADCCDGITQHCPSHALCKNNQCVCKLHDTLLCCTPTGCPRGQICVGVDKGVGTSCESRCVL